MDIEGRNLEIRIVSILGSGKSAADAAAEVLASRPDALVAVTPIAAEALHQKTQAIPTIFVVGWFNPVEKGFVTAINQPSGNMTGITDLEPSLGGKWVQLLKQIAPATTRAGIVYNPNEGTISSPLLQTLKESAGHIAMQVVDLPIRTEGEVESTISGFAGEASGGLIFPSDVFTAAHRTQFIAATNSHRIPTVFPYRYYAADGGLAAYSPNQPSEFGQAAYFVDSILRGQKPGDLPVQTPNKYELVINLKTASAEIDTAFATLVREQADALFVAADAFFNSRRVQFATLTASHKIPAADADREIVEAGGLMSYGTDFTDMFRQVGVYVGRILKGEKPSDLPVVQASKYQLVINLTAAKALSLTVPTPMQLLADEVIE